MTSKAITIYLTTSSIGTKTAYLSIEKAKEYIKGKGYKWVSKNGITGTEIYKKVIKGRTVMTIEVEKIHLV